MRGPSSPLAPAARSPTVGGGLSDLFVRQTGCDCCTSEPERRGPGCDPSRVSPEKCASPLTRRPTHLCVPGEPDHGPQACTLCQTPCYVVRGDFSLRSPSEQGAMSPDFRDAVGTRHSPSHLSPSWFRSVPLEGTSGSLPRHCLELGCWWGPEPQARLPAAGVGVCGRHLAGPHRVPLGCTR